MVLAHLERPSSDEMPVIEHGPFSHCRTLQIHALSTPEEPDLKLAELLDRGDASPGEHSENVEADSLAEGSALHHVS